MTEEKKTKPSENAALTIASKSEIENMLQSAADKMGSVAPQWVTPERIIRIILLARSRSEKLQKATPESYLKFCMKCAETGLEPKGPGGVWPVPFWNKHVNAYEVQFVPDYRGLIYLAKKTGQISDAWAKAVYENELRTFQYVEGLEPVLYHEPLVFGDRGEFVGVYAVIVSPDGIRRPEFLRKDEIEKIKLESKNPDGIWTKWFEAMAKKTVFKQALKSYEGSSLITSALAYDNETTGLIDPVQDVSPIEEPRALPEQVGQ